MEISKKVVSSAVQEIKSDIEIIPVKSQSGKKYFKHHKSGSSKMQRMQPHPYLADPTIVPRVQKYLESNVDKTYVDINVMADDLQQKYRDYTRRKRSAFRQSVKKAYSIVLQSYGVMDQGQSSSEEEISDESYDEEQNSTSNNQMLNMYNRASAAPRQIDENIVDISSDSEVDDSDSKKPNSVSSNQNNDITVEIPRAEIFKTYEHSNSVDRGKKRKLDNSSPPAPLSKKKKSTTNATFDATIPHETLDDLAGMDKILLEIMPRLAHLHNPKTFKTFGIQPSFRGILLHGPPGTGKTLVAHAIAGELDLPLLKVTSTELVSGISGDSEERVRELFQMALSLAPCVVFIDELDAIGSKRQDTQKGMENRIVSQLSTCLHSLDKEKNGDMVLVLAATNRPTVLDPALRTKGRFDKEIYLGAPNVEAREQILKLLTSKMKLSPDIDYKRLADYTPGYVGGDLLALRDAVYDAVTIRIICTVQACLERDKKDLMEKVLAKKSKELPKNDTEVIVDDIDEGSETKDKSPTDSTVVVIDDDLKQVVEPTSQPGKEIANGEKSDASMQLLETVLVASAPATIPTTTPPPPPSPLEPLKWDMNVARNWLKQGQLTEKHMKQVEESSYVTMDDFLKALKIVQPTSKREGFVTVPNVSWDDIGSLRDIREELYKAIVVPVRDSEFSKKLNYSIQSAGLLLCGPPGCGKTLIAKAVANEAGFNFISVKGPELLNKYVGESEKAVRECFTRASFSAPCIIFFDEFDALCPKRESVREESVSSRLVNMLLTEMDGITERQNVFILAATNRPEDIDQAVLRPGRLDKVLYVGIPKAIDRVDILRAITKNGTQPRLAPDVDLEMIAMHERCEGFTGADLHLLIKEAYSNCLTDKEHPLREYVTTEHIIKALGNIRPSISDKDRKHYDELKKRYCADNEDEEMEIS